MKHSSRFSAGELVQVRSKEEILATLDKQGRLGGLPFQPEMFEYCGKQFTVFKRAHKTCDPPNGITGRHMDSAVHLDDLRCNGAAHGGCEARCLFFWKDDWLKKVDAGSASVSAAAPVSRAGAGGCTEQDVWAAACTPGGSDGPTYACQSTEIAAATTAIRWWDMRQYVEDYASGNERLSKMIGSFLAWVAQQVISSGIGLGAACRAVYDAFQKLRGGTPYPWQYGRVPAGARTPTATLNLQPGELVRVKPYKEILETITEQGFNRGMTFDAEMVPFCGGAYRVLARVKRIVNEKTGKMLDLKNDCIMLEDVLCQACYARNRRFCPRSIYPYWREIWLERVADAADADAARAPMSPPVSNAGNATDGAAALAPTAGVFQPLRLVPNDRAR